MTCRLLSVASVALASLAGAAFAAEPLPFHGWTLTQDDMDYNLAVIGQVRDFGVTHVQLSHRIVTRVDQFQTEPEVVQRVRVLADAIHAQGGQAIVWMQELNTSDTYTYCFDLDGEDMQAKMQAYRDALTAAPEIDGVMISFGSAPTELAYIVPSCQPLAFAAVKEKYKAMIEAVSRVVMDEFGKQVYVRTFYHKGYEIPYLRSAIAETQRPIVAMSKSEPNDFEPYYPLNALMGDIGPHDQIFELDCAGEYWGRGAIPFVAAEYFAQRYREARARQTDAASPFIGSTCRVDRYEYSAMGTLNEANLFAQAQLVGDSDLDWQTILDRFIRSKFGVEAGTAPHRQLFDILRRTYWVGRKMYYAKGEWAFKKGSELPASNAEALSLMFDKTISQWDVAYAPVTAQLLSPSRPVVLELLQEKFEAMDLAQRNLDALPELRTRMAAQVFASLETLLTKQRVATEIWFHMAGAVFGGRSLSPESSAWVSWHLDELERLADALDNGAYPQIVDPYPFPSSDLRAFVDNTRGGFSQSEAAEPTWLAITGIDVLNATDQSIEVQWDAKAGVNYHVQLTEQLPSYTQTRAVGAIVDDGPMRVTIDGLSARTPYWFRVQADGDGETMVSGDYTAWTRKAGGDAADPDETDSAAAPGGSGTMGLVTLLGLFWLGVLAVRGRSIRRG